MPRWHGSKTLPRLVEDRRRRKRGGEERGDEGDEGDEGG